MWRNSAAARISGLWVLSIPTACRAEVNSTFRVDRRRSRLRNNWLRRQLIEFNKHAVAVTVAPTTQIWVGCVVETVAATVAPTIGGCLVPQICPKSNTLKDNLSYGAPQSWNFRPIYSRKAPSKIEFSGRYRQWSIDACVGPARSSTPIEFVAGKSRVNFCHAMKSLGEVRWRQAIQTAENEDCELVVNPLSHP